VRILYVHWANAIVVLKEGEKIEASLEGFANRS
jgi:hypothetical protein